MRGAIVTLVLAACGFPHPPELPPDSSSALDPQRDAGDTDASDAHATDAATTDVPVSMSCGDGKLDLGEQCDDGNTTDTGNGCTANCQRNDVCGDGIVQGLFEDCDDHNTSVCGSCSADCRALRSARATGVIAPAAGSDLVDGDQVTLDDGASAPTTFDFTNGTPSAGHIKVAFSIGDARSAMAAKLVSAINGVAATLRITASNGGSGIVLLTHDNATALGNNTITESVATPDFVVLGMSGGAGGDCAVGVGCSTDRKSVV